MDDLINRLLKLRCTYSSKVHIFFLQENVRRINKSNSRKEICLCVHFVIFIGLIISPSEINGNDQQSNQSSDQPFY